MKQFTIKLTAITAAIALIGWLIFTFFLPQFYLTVFPFLLLFFFVVTMLIHAYQVNRAKKDTGKFIRSIMLITFLKLILFSVVAFAYIVLDSGNALPFVICLMLLYLIFTSFEVFEMTHISQSIQKK